VGAYSTFTASLTIANKIPSTGMIFIYFPKWEQTSLGATFPDSMLDQVTSCSAGSDIAGNTPTCTVTVSSSSTGLDMITVTNAFTSLSSGLSSGKTLSITISKVRNLPTMTKISKYAIYTSDSDSNYID
jgi:hypothetical protein